VVVRQATERAAHHFVAEVAGPVECSDATREFLDHTEMPTAPGHLVIEAKQSGCHAGNSLLAAGPGRRYVSFDTSGQIEAHGRRRGDVQFDLDDGHRLAA
jgi:hypothetical protein